MLALLQNATFGITMTDDTTVQTNYDIVREVKPTKYLVVNNQTDPHSLTMQYNAATVFGDATASKTTAAFGTNPPDDQFFDCWLQGPTPSDGAGMWFNATIEYYVEFSELRDLGGS